MTIPSYTQVDSDAQNLILKAPGLEIRRKIIEKRTLSCSPRGVYIERVSLPPPFVNYPPVTASLMECNGKRPEGALSVTFS